ncbi:MAG: putative lipoprotein [Acidimicrobiia bacterium]|nr:putative lipoprotein [Acidimicrobiia bacterium]
MTKDNGTDSAWAVNGTITIENNTPLNATIVSVTDVISGFGAVTADCGVTFPHVLAAGGTLECDYSTALPNGTSRTNTATVTTSGAVGGGSDDAAVTFGTPTTFVNDTINVEDEFEDEDPVDLGEFNDTGSTTYTRTFTCDDDEGTHENTATIVETGLG